MQKKYYAAGIISILVILIICAVFISCASAGAAAGSGKEVTVYEESFEYSDGGWGPRGEALVKQAAGKGRGGSGALYISNRKKTWQGAIKPFSIMKPGQTYRISVWVLVEEGSDSPSISLQVQQNVEGQGETYMAIGGERVPLGIWTYIEGELTVPRSRFETVTSVYFESAYKADDATLPSDLFNFYIDDVKIARLPPSPPPEVEKDIPDLSGILPEIPLGTAIDFSYLNPDNIHHGLLRHFNAYVYGNEMKQENLQPQEGRFSFDRADALMDYAAKNNKKVRGHVLVWHQQVPGWFFQGSGPDGLATKEELYARMENHIKTVVGRYKGKVDSWDVVNEVLDEDGSLRNSKYYQIVKSHEYIAKAFQWAREADPDAKLFINDYGVEAAGAKQDGYFKLISELLKEGVPVQGVGLQAHISVSWPTAADLRNAIRRFASLGLKVQVTELDLSIYANGGEPKKRAGREILLEQAFKYRSLFEMFREEAGAGSLDMVMMWGIADDDSWLNNHPVRGRTDYPLFFGKNLRAKPAYWVMVNPENLPIQIKKIDASRTDTALSDINDPFWRLISPRFINDAKGNSYGWFKTAWDEKNIYVQVHAANVSNDGADGVTFFIDPQNQKLEEKPADVSSVFFSRQSAAQDDGGSYTLLAAIPFAGKLEQKVGFDVRLQDGGALHSWNDLGNSQDKVTINYGTINLRTLPVSASVRRGSVQIDGQISEWASVPAIPLNLKTQGNTPDGSTFKVLYDNGYLYVLVDVVDPVLDDSSPVVHEQDSVEVFLDQNNGKTASYESDDGQYRVNFKNAASFNGGDSARFKSAARTTARGYLVEMALPLYEVTAQSGVLLGFDVQINDAASGARTGIRNWVDGTGQGYQSTAGYGLLLLE